MFPNYTAYFHSMLNPPRPQGVEDVAGAAFRIWAEPSFGCPWMIASFDGKRATVRVSSVNLYDWWRERTVLKDAGSKLTAAHIKKLQSYRDKRLHVIPEIHQAHFDLGSWRNDWEPALQPAVIRDAFTHDGANLDGTRYGADVSLRDGEWFELFDYIAKPCELTKAITALIDIAQPALKVQLERDGLPVKA